MERKAAGRKASLKEKEIYVDQKKGYKAFMGAKLLWPPECTDDIIFGAVTQSQLALNHYEDIAKDGKLVKKKKIQIQNI